MVGAVTDEMRKVAREAAGPGSDIQKLRRLHRFLLDEDAFPFDYSSSGTYPATEVFRSRRGNCVSFTILFLALARAANLPVRAALPKVAPTIHNAAIHARSTIAAFVSSMAAVPPPTNVSANGLSTARTSAPIRPDVRSEKKAMGRV